jgi:hypothetical protein
MSEVETYNGRNKKNKSKRFEKGMSEKKTFNQRKQK